MNHPSVQLLLCSALAAPLESTISASGANRPGIVGTSSDARRATSASGVALRRLTRSVSDAGWLLNCSHRSVASNPIRSYQRVTSHSGCESVVDRYSSAACRFDGSEGRGGRGSARRDREIDRSTALTKPEALRFFTCLVRSTASSTTAAAGTLVR